MRARHDSTHIEKGPSLARGPAWIVGSVLAVFGLILFFKAPGTPLTTDRLPDGQVQGVGFLGFEINAWTAWLTTAAGVLVLIGVLQHVIAKAMSLLVGLALGAAAVIALIDGSDVLGLAAANGFTALGWGVAAAILLVTALLPRRRREVTDQDAVATTSGGHRDRGTSARVDHDGDHDANRHHDANRDHRANPDPDRVPATAPGSNRDHDSLDDREQRGDFRGTGDQNQDGLPDRVEPVPAREEPTAVREAPRAEADYGSTPPTPPEPLQRTGRFDRSRREESIDGRETETAGQTMQFPPRRDQ